MKTNGLLYSSKNNKRGSDKFLSKEELRRVFPDDNEVVLTINYVRKCKKIASRREGKYVIKKNYPKNYSKSRVIRL